MYRWLLCWRYLRTRFIALASVISVTLGVATLLIVNAVMDGFVTEMQDRIHGILSDVVIESHSASGMPNHEQLQSRIRQIVGDQIEGMTTVVHVPAMVCIDHRGESITRQINLIGIDTQTYSKVSDFSKYLLHPENCRLLSFGLRESGYAPDRQGFPDSGWQHRRQVAAGRKRIAQLQAEIEQQRQQRIQLLQQHIDSQPLIGPGEGSLATDESDGDSRQSSESQIPLLTTDATVDSPPVASSLLSGPGLDAVDTRPEDVGKLFDPEVDQHTGIVMGISIGATRYRDQYDEVHDYYYVQPGDDVKVTFPSAGTSPRAIEQRFTVVDFYESKMSEYDSTFAFVPLDQLQQFRGMSADAVSSIQLKLKPGADLEAVRDRLRAQFPLEMMIQVNSWRDLQGPLLAATQMEITLLNILLFLIIAVAGFGILAIFFMIVVEKTKDIGILKSLGASGRGVASIFLGYGLLLGLVGAGAGAVAGLLFVDNIDGVAEMTELITGREVFDPTIYYFQSIPTIVRPVMVICVVAGAISIAVLASVLPALRAARMHPVEALRYE
ncbi:MAG: FtsX-like permease family protein [Pirellulaceae bacterium]|nr:FtsX-like permease family protein [Pirellulaceae bacterium]